MSINTNEKIVPQVIGINNTSTQNSGKEVNVSPNSIDTSTSGSNSEISVYGLISTNIQEVADLKRRINDLEKQQGKTKSFYKSVTKLSNLSTIIIGVMLIIPMLQLIGCAAVVYYLGIQDNLPGLLNWVLGGVSLFSLIEMIFIPIKFYFMETKISSLDEKYKEENT